jgi:hypothetical protein
MLCLTSKPIYLCTFKKDGDHAISENNVNYKQYGAAKERYIKAVISSNSTSTSNTGNINRLYFVVRKGSTQYHIFLNNLYTLILTTEPG